MTHEVEKIEAEELRKLVGTHVTFIVAVDDGGGEIRQSMEISCVIGEPGERIVRGRTGERIKVDSILEYLRTDTANAIEIHARGLSSVEGQQVRVTLHGEYEGVPSFYARVEPGSLKLHECSRMQYTVVLGGALYSLADIAVISYEGERGDKPNLIERLRDYGVGTVDLELQGGDIVQAMYTHCAYSGLMDRKWHVYTDKGAFLLTDIVDFERVPPKEMTPESGTPKGSDDERTRGVQRYEVMGATMADAIRALIGRTGVFSIHTGTGGSRYTVRRVKGVGDDYVRFENTDGEEVIERLDSIRRIRTVTPRENN